MLIFFNITFLYYLFYKFDEKYKFFNLKKFFILLLSVLLFSCERHNEDILQNENSAQKHFVKIEQIRDIVSKPKFESLLTKVNPNINLYKKSSQPIVIIDFREYKDKNNLTAFYLTKLSCGNIAIFAADNRSHVVMGLTDLRDVNITIQNIPSEFSYWIEDEIDAIEFARDKNLPQTSEIQKEWSSYNRLLPPDDPTICYGAFHETKNPLLTTEWGQGTGYNNYAPNLGCSNYLNGNAPTGCVATATAQIMKYFQHPLSYNWSDMPNNWGTNSTSLLMANIGTSVGMKYSCDGSGAKTSNVPNALKNSFGYISGKILQTTITMLC